MTTIHDVAKQAKVSAAAVSYAFNKPHLIKPETYERILEAARDLGYTPNVFAQALRGAKTQMVGLIVPDIRFPYIASIARGIEDALSDEEYFAVIACADGNPKKEVEIMQKLQRRGAGGFIIIPVYYGVAPEVRQEANTLTELGIPYVVGGHRIDDRKVNTVHFRPQTASKEAVDYLINLGHEDIAFIGAKFSQGLGIYRWLGYQESFLSHQLPIRQELIKEININTSETKQALAELLDLPRPPTAIFAFNDVIGIGVIDLCLERNINIPTELSIVSFDYLTIAQRSTPAITSIVVSAYDIGRKSAELLLQCQQFPDLPPQQIIVDYHLEVRETTAPRQ